MGWLWGIIWGAIKGVLGNLLGQPAAPSRVELDAATAAQAESDANVAQATGAAEARVAAAEVNAPTTQAALVSELDNGTF